MILIISTCKEKFSELEFVNPIKQIVGKATIKQYKEIKELDIKRAEKIIICGTALQDNEYLKHLTNFNWLQTTTKPVLGICAGSQILALQFQAKLIKKTEIGIIEVTTVKENSLCKEIFEVYTIHQNSVTNLHEFEVLAESKDAIHIFKHKQKPFYGCMFHPEVKNKEIIEKFRAL